MTLSKVFAINLKYYRKKFNLSQEKFAEVLGTTLSYLNQIENNKVDIKSSTIDKFTNRINLYNSSEHITYEDLIVYKKEKITNFSRIDEKGKIKL